MNKSTSTPYNSLNSQSKDTEFIDQLKKVYLGFFQEPQSMKMLAVKLEIDRSNICWYCRDFRKNKQIGIFKRGLCKITKRCVNYYTTNLDLIPSNNQTKLF